MNIWALVLAFAGGLAACGTSKHQGHDNASVPSAFDRKYQLYSSLQKDWDASTCDWTLFRSLQDAARRTTGVVETAQGEPGQWFRSPSHDCYPNHSGSSISRDMLLGLAVYLWQKGDTDNAKAVVDYADAHNGNMGEGDPFRIDIRPGLYSTFRAIAATAASAPFPQPPQVENPDPNAPTGATLTDSIFTQHDYEAHLTVTMALLQGSIYGGVTPFTASVLKAQAERLPRNAFYLAVYHRFTDGDQTAAIAALMDESLFPNDRLPTSAEFCTDWIWQRDYGPDWEPCSEGKTHTGADWLVAAAVIRNGFRAK